MQVALEDVMPEKLRRAQDEYAEFAAGGGGGSLRYASTVEDAVHDADLVIDFVPDELESKLEIFSLLDRMAPPRTILCTPTLALSVTDLASCTYRPTLCVGLRAAGSDVLNAGVGVIRSRFVSDGALDAVGSMLARMGVDSLVVEDREEPMLVKNL